MLRCSDSNNLKSRFPPLPIRTLSVGSVAGAKSPAFLDLLLVSISCGAKRPLGLVSTEEDGLLGIDTGVGSGVGRALPEFLEFLKLLYVVSRGVGKKRFLPAESVRSFAVSLAACARWEAVDTSSVFLELLAVVSSGSGTNRRACFETSSIGTGWKRLDEGGASDIVPDTFSRLPNHSVTGDKRTHSNAM